MSIGGSSGKQTTTTNPWAGAVPYLTGKTNKDGSVTPGIFPEAAQLYASGGWTPEMQQLADSYAGLFPARQEGAAAMTDIAKNVAGGAFNSFVNAPATVTANQVTPTTIQPIGINPGEVNSSARAAQGSLDPTQAYQKLLQGDVQNQYLDPLMNTVIENISRNTRENVLPSIRSGSLNSGQYGSSRQGVAEGLALSRMQQDMATGIAPIYAQAFENAQNRMQGVASELNLQAERVATGNVDRRFAADRFNSEQGVNTQQYNATNNLNSQQFNANNNLNAQQFNVGAGQTYNSQNLAANQANLGNVLKASDLYGQAQNFQDLGFNQYMQLLGLPQQYNQNLLNQYASIIQPGAGLGGTSTATAQQGRNPIAGALGGALAGGAIGSVPGAVIGGLGGLLMSLF